MPYRTRKDISTHKELLREITTFWEIFSFIFPYSGKPTIEISVYDRHRSESHLFIINTKYRRNASEIIVSKYNELLATVDFFKNFDNIAEVSFSAKGTVRGSQIIYGNLDTPWNYHSMLMEKKYHNVI